MILRNGYILLDNKLVRRDIEITNGIITKIEDSIDCKEYIDCKEGWIIEGAVDVHVHLREPGFTHKETILSGTKASAKGGVTTIMSMPNLKPCPDSIENLKVQEDIIVRDAQVHVYPYAAVTKGQLGQENSDLESLCKKVKAITDDGVGVNNIDLLTKAMKYAKKYNIVIASHAEDLVDSKLPQGEYVAVRREIELAKQIGCKYHFCHMSTKESFDAIRQAHKEGYTNITCEVSPHHLLLNENMIKDANWKMNPPLRSEENRKETIKALLDGTALMIASDHAPHAKEEKEQEYSKAPNGIIGIETMLPLIYTHFVDKGIATHSDFLNWFVYNPIKVFSLPERKLEVGYPGDLTVLDINTLRKYTKEEILSLSTNSPYIDMEMKGFPLLTLVNGKIVWEVK